MLQALSIRNFIIVEALDLEFAQGFTTLTGETGAGKSILIDALSLALGARNEGDVVRAGQEKADISLNFFIGKNTQAKQWLADNEMESADELMLRRVIYNDGRSRAFINGAAATVGQLKELGEFLVDIYSQNAHHSLLNVNTQRQVLDEFALASALSKQVAKHFKTWATVHKQRLEVEKNAAAYADELAELRDKTRELKQLGFDADEWTELQAEHARLSNGAALLSGGEACVALIGEDEVNSLSLLAQVQHKLTELTEFDPQLKEASDNVDSAVIQLEEASRYISRYLQRAELDPARLNAVENRILAIHATSRKYRIKPEELNEMLVQDEARVQTLESFAEDGVLAKQEADALAMYQAEAKKLSQLRQQTAKTLSTKITQEMQRLSLNGGQFAVQLSPCEASANGLESVEFLVAGHAGVEPRPLNKVASGGELSRISLALHVTLALHAFHADSQCQGRVLTMIFDEVDVGIGGAVAEVVGKLLKQLGSNSQVLVITHLAQVAAQAEQHMQVSKSQTNGTTLSHIQRLTETQRIEEVARMLGGLHITETTRNHAKEMLGI